MKVHSVLGPGLLESVYEAALCHELARMNLGVQRQLAIPVLYEGLSLRCGFRADVVVENAVLMEIKAVQQLTPLHDSQLLTYLRLSGLPVGLLMNFNVRHLRDGLRRRVLFPS